MHVCIYCIYACMYIFIYYFSICIYTAVGDVAIISFIVHRGMCVCMRACVYIYTCIYTYMYTHIHCTFRCVCVCVCVCVGHHKTTWQGFSHQVWMYVCLCACVRVCVYRVSQDDVARLFTPSLDRHRYLRHPRSHGRWHGVPRVVVVRGTVYSYMYMVCLEWWSYEVLCIVICTWCA